MAVQDKLGAEDLKQYYNSADGIRLSPGWLGGEEEASPELAPYLWRWSEVEPLVLKSGEVVTPDRDVERRTMRLATPRIKAGNDPHSDRRAPVAAAWGVCSCAPPYSHRHSLDT